MRILVVVLIVISKSEDIFIHSHCQTKSLAFSISWTIAAFYTC